MTTKDQVIEIIYNAVDMINDSDDLNLEKSPESVLYGEDSELDSLGLVNLIVETEEAIQDKFDTTIAIADERAMSQKRSPFRTIDTLADYICLLLEENADG